jgi:hypothetical protein
VWRRSPSRNIESSKPCVRKQQGFLHWSRHMPKKAPTPCRHPGCAQVVERSGYCDEHKRDAVGWRSDAHRGNRHERGYGSEWTRLRIRILKRDCGLCQPCLRAGDVTTSCRSQKTARMTTATCRLSATRATRPRRHLRAREREGAQPVVASRSYGGAAKSLGLLRPGPRIQARFCARQIFEGGGGKKSAP